MNIVIFEDEGWANLAPISLTRHVSQQVVGTSTILDWISGSFGGEVSLAGREAVAEVASEETGLEFNVEQKGDVLLINGRLNPTCKLDREKVSGRRRFTLSDSGGSIAIASLSAEGYQKALSKEGVLPQKELHRLCRGLDSLSSEASLLFGYPWEMISCNDLAITQGTPATKGRKPAGVALSPHADVEENVSFDTRLGPVVVADGASIESFSRIAGPAYIGKNSVVHSALVREGTTISENCRVGGEVERSIIYPYSNKAHFGFLGHSILGSWVNMGAGSVTSDLKSTYGTIKATSGGKRVDTGMLKLGTIAGDMAKVGSGSIINGGKTLGVSSHVSGMVDKDIPAFRRFDGRNPESSVVLQLDSVLETQSRMMGRRDLEMSKARRKLIQSLYAG